MVTLRPADMSDIDRMTALLLEDAEARAETDQMLWGLAADAAIRVRANLEATLTAEAPAFRQRWLVGESAGAVAGVTHTIHLPVPPIYAGAFGPPGLIMEDCALSADAPDGTAEALIAAAEADLTDAGAVILLASSVPGGPFEAALGTHGYEPLTLYFSKSGLAASDAASSVRPATEADLPGIVALSADSRRVLHALDPFWQPHDEAAARFGAWMGKSLILPDRDMAVAGPADALDGYVISQPITPLHLPPAHDISRTGIIDDFHHRDMSDPAHLAGEGAGALFASAEAALARRGVEAALVVCPAAWTSKIAVLQDAGYAPAISWHIKRATLPA